VWLSEAKLLLIEDEPESRELFVELLSNHFGEILFAPSAEEGWELYRESTPDLLLSDISLPGIDGVELTKRIRKEDCEIPIFWLSAHNDVDLHREAASLQVDGLFLKPLMDLESLVNSLNREIGPRRARGE
jgi:CheY-like chemotaxis protein